ncbi:uncharacterized protein LOC110660410 isoform X2 [Hevea brasiliensis]|uniref:uncharacterized protein LOC110660410 isoform X2 n=1 Tax=Hevea brasiliensis TaxID=3981 RepID=UPI0025E5DC4D|nr:uncharacterized protein LOC110660410 isoform X2 [Hevea brasiliensis]
MVLDMFISIFTEIIKDPIMQFVVVPIKRHISYPFTYKTKVERLQDEAQQLNSKRDRLQQSVADASRRGEEIYDDVSKWLISAGEAIQEAEQLIQAKEQAKERCFIGLCPNLKTRYHLSKKAEKKASLIGKLRNQDGLESISHPQPPKQKVAPSVYDREELPSRVSILKEIMDSLRDPDLNMIGVYGMGGVGKTTLAREVHRRAQYDKLFDVVIFVTVSQSLELRRIQAEVAEVLGLDLHEEGILLRANRLYERLNKEKILIILDDIWTKLQLEEVGIPFGPDCNGCKILLTSRRRDVCHRMGAQKVLELEVLREEESWNLFKITVSVADGQEPKLPPLATEIAKKCAGLPLLILKVATDLQMKESYMWDDKLKQLSDLDNEEIQNKVHLVLKLSYDNLPRSELRSFFLLCGLFGQSNIQIQNLLKYVMGVGLFKHIATVKDARNKVYTLIDELKAECLLLDGDMNGYVKMHDIVRDTALLIASKEQHIFIGTSGAGLGDLPTKDCTRISIPYCDIQALPQGMECPKADLLSVFTEDLSLDIPQLIFDGIRRLKVVDFTGMCFMSLPSSLGFLTDLHSLCLHRCHLDDIAIIGELKQLEVLSLADSYIVELPRQIEQLSRLKLLDIGNCSNLKVIPANVLSKFSMLEELYVSNSFVEWEAEAISNQGNASLAELEGLSHLRTLEIQVVDAKIIPKALFFNGLESYRILIGDVWDWHGNFETSRTLKLMLKTSSYLEHGIRVLLRETEDLYLDEVRGIENVLYDIDGEGFPRLKHFHFQNDVLIQRIISSPKWAPYPAFPILESLFLENLMNLETICHGQLARGSFSQLRTLEVRKCQILEAMIIDESEYNNEVVEFNQLRSLKLNDLPNLRSFCWKMKMATGTEARQKQLTACPLEEIVSEDELGAELSFFNRMVSFPNLEELQLTSIACERIWNDQLSATCSNLTSLTVERCNNLKHLFTTSIVKCLLQLKKLKIKECNSMEEILLTEELVEEEEEERINKTAFSKLESLHLSFLRHLSRFCTGYSIEFQCLQELTICECSALVTFVAKADTKRNTEIQPLFDEMVSFSKLEVLYIKNMNNLKNIWHNQLAADSFCKLKSLSINSCSRLVTVFPLAVLERFLRLEKLDLSYCASVQEIYQLQGYNVREVGVAAAFELRDLHILNCNSLKHIWTKDPQGVFTFQNLKSVYVGECNVLKNIFPASIAQGLLKLEKLELSRCKEVEEIVAQEEGVDLKNIFPQLLFLKFLRLPKLRSLYSGGTTNTFEWPKLKFLEVRNCHKVRKFGSEISDEKEVGQQSIPIEKPLFFLGKVSPKLEELTLGHKDLSAIQHGLLPFQCFSKLRVLNLFSLRDESRPFLILLLKRVSHLDKISVSFSHLEELFSREGLVGEEEHAIARILTQVKNLELSVLDNLKCIWNQDSRVQPLLLCLQTLKVSNCGSLINVAPSSSSSFLSLTTLEVNSCRRLKNLIMASTAKSMVQLSKMIVHFCEAMTEIVASDGEHNEDEIIFCKLKYLELSGLSSLTSFCTGNQVFNFPSLEIVIVESCFRMKKFSGGFLITPKLRGIRLNKYADKQHWEGNLNETMACQLTNMQVGTHFQVSGYPELWNGKIQGKLFHNVEILTVNTRTFTSNAISAHLLQFLNKLRQINVTDSDSLEVVFDLEGLSSDNGHVGLLPRLSELKLMNLPMLRQLWNKHPHGILDFKCLRWLKIENCSSLKYIFTGSMALCLSQLQEVELKYCKMMEGIIEVGKCQRLEAMIIDESEYNNEVVEFNQLRSLKLNDLPNLRSFCWKRKVATVTEARQKQLTACPLEEIVSEDELGTELSLFNRMVSFPNLEELQLTSVACERIWNDQLSATCSNLTSLIVYECNNLKHLFTTSIVKCLLQLKKLKIKDCNSMEEILLTEELVEEEEEERINKKRKRYSIEFQCLQELTIDGCSALVTFVAKADTKRNAEIQPLFDEMVSFSKLEVLYIKNMNNLKNIWHNQLAADSFCKLKSLSILFCPRLVTVFPLAVLERFQRLEELDLWHCDSVQEIYQLQGYNVKEVNVAAAFELRDLLIFCCHSLKHIWSKDPQGVFTFQNLESVIVTGCNVLKNIFPASIAQGLLKLEKLELGWCEEVEEIVAQEEGVDLKNIFLQLHTLEFSGLPKLRSFYSGGTHTFEWPKLKCLKVKNCDKVRKFGSEISDEKEVGQQSIPIEKPLFFLGKVSPKLEELTLEHKDLSAIQHGLLPFQCFSKLRVLNLLSLRDESRPFLILLLKRVSHLDKISVSYSYLEELFSHEGLVGEEEHAIARILTRVKNLELDSLDNLKCIWNQDSRVQPLLQCLQTLKVSDCGSLINVAPSSSSFLSLTTLEVDSCGRLKNLLMASTAKNMVQLSKMIIRYCQAMTEIVASDGDHNEDEIIFCKLKYLELSGLSSLTSFCTGNHVFNFPSLEIVIVERCLRMKKFSGGFLITPKLRGIRLNKFADKQHWEGNLNATMACQLTNMQVGTDFQVSKFPELWNGKIQGKHFHNVESLTVDTCTFTSNAISAHLLQFLNKLRRINVTDSDSLEGVFDLEGLSSDNGLLPRLSELKLMNLPMLRQLWNKHPHGILDFKNLRLLQIENCSSLKYIFTGSMALCLSQLQEVELKYCNMMEGIIEVEEANKMIFPSLKSMILECLPKFSNFCSRSSNLKCPSLKKMSIYDCPSMKTFFSTLLREQKPKGNGEGREQRQDKEEFDVPFSHKMFPKLEELSLDSKSVMMLLQSEFPTEFFSKLKVVGLRSFPNKSCASLFRFLPKLPNLEELGVRDSSLKELFVLKGLGGDQKDTITPSRIRALKLNNLGDLINLAPSSATFQNLTTLEVSNCNGLKNMVTSTAAKSMVQLEILTVNSCDMLIEIVGGKHHETTEEIVFTKLKTLKLSDLQSLTSFCLGCYTLKFPSLEQVTVVRCPNLRIFNPGVLSTPKLQSVEVAWRKFHWERDLNATIEHSYEKAIGFEGISHVKLSNFPMLKENWNCQFPFKRLENLKSLVVDECAFFSNAISSNLLKHARYTLKELAVEKCDSVEELFDLEGLNADEGHLRLMSNLNELRLIDLPRLRHVWNKDPQGFLSFKNLELLQVHNCSNLANIFTLSMALGLVNLQHMEVKRCRMVEHIIRKEADDEIGRDRTIFPSLHSISIECLPNLSCFYSAREVLKCPSLKKIDVVDCPKMKLLASAFRYEQDSSVIVEGSEESVYKGDVDISMAPFLGGKVAIPSLEELKVEWKTMKDMWPEKFQSVFLSGLKGIELTCYPGGSELLPTDFFQILINLEKLVLRDASFEAKTFHEANIGEQLHPESCKVPMLKHLMEKDSQQVPASQYLETEAMDCGRLKILLPFTVSFENLTTLEVSNCQGLINLMTSITSRSLVQLRRMKVEKCEMMQEIVASETDDAEEQICFSQLQYLELHDLPRLTSFCSANPAFNFPSLEEVIIRACPNMKIFAKEVLSTPKLWRVQTGKHKYEWEWEGSLNNTIEALFAHTNPEEIGEASVHMRELQ